MHIERDRKGDWKPEEASSLTGAHRELAEKIFWPDSQLESITIDYDVLRLRLCEPTGEVAIVRCEGYIGYSCLGFWDDNIVASFELSSSDPMIDACRAEVSRHYPTSERLPEPGIAARRLDSAILLIVTFIDMTTLKIVASVFKVERLSGAQTM